MSFRFNLLKWWSTILFKNVDAVELATCVPFIWLPSSLYLILCELFLRRYIKNMIPKNSVLLLLSRRKVFGLLQLIYLNENHWIAVKTRNSLSAKYYVKTKLSSILLQYDQNIFSLPFDWAVYLLIPSSTSAVINASNRSCSSQTL